MNKTILEVKNLVTEYRKAERAITAVDNVSFILEKGKVLGIVGESGCGKSTVARSIVGLTTNGRMKIRSGSILYNGQNLVEFDQEQMRRIRGSEISMIFQDPFTSLNPVYTIKNQMLEVLQIHGKLTSNEAEAKMINLLKQVRITSPEERLHSYPHQLSGGMQQRVMIAIALACKPKILLADEPTPALDVTVQAQILSILSSLQKEYAMSILIISHNLGVIAEMCDRVMVMYAGVIVEEADCNELFAQPIHPYTQGLMKSIPNLNLNQDVLEPIPGTVPSFTSPVNMCRFTNRCSQAMPICSAQDPPMIEMIGGRKVKCWLYHQEREG